MTTHKHFALKCLSCLNKGYVDDDDDDDDDDDYDDDNGWEGAN